VKGVFFKLLFLVFRSPFTNPRPVTCIYSSFFWQPLIYAFVFHSPPVPFCPARQWPCENLSLFFRFPGAFSLEDLFLHRLACFFLFSSDRSPNSLAFLTVPQRIPQDWSALTYHKHPPSVPATSCSSLFSSGRSLTALFPFHSVSGAGTSLPIRSPPNQRAPLLFFSLLTSALNRSSPKSSSANPIFYFRVCVHFYSSYPGPPSSRRPPFAGQTINSGQDSVRHQNLFWPAVAR